MGKRLVLITLLMTILAISLIGCGKKVGTNEDKPVVTGETKVIAVVQFKQETNIFSPVNTTLRDFEAQGLRYGSDVLSGKLDGELEGFMASVNDFGNGGIEVIPVLKASAVSGGPIKAEVYNRFKNEIIEGLKKIESLDGLYLSLHGSMGVEGMNDPEGDLLQAVREVIGDEVPVGVSFDLHANITESNARLATFIVGYQTNPHRDQYESGYTSGKILIKTACGEIQPVMSFKKMKLLKGGGTNIDFLPPMNEIFQWMKKVQKQEDVLSISNFMVHIWMDEPDIGWSTVVVTDNKPELGDKLAEELADKDWEVRDYKHTEGYSPSEAVKLARKDWISRKLGTVMFCDVSDAVGAGAPGESTLILKALIEEGSDMVSYIPIRDKEAVLKAYEASVGGEITLTLGGKLEKVYNKPLEVTGRIIKKLEGQYGKTVILQIGKTYVVLIELSSAVMTPEFYTSLGLDLWKADIVVAKNLFPFRIWFLKYNRKTIDVITPGTTSVDLDDLKYKNCPRPIYPLDKIEDWH